MSDWQVGDLAVCVAPVAPLELGCTYTVAVVHGPLRCLRDDIRERGLSLVGVEPIQPSNPCVQTIGFDIRRFLRVKKDQVAA